MGMEEYEESAGALAAKGRSTELAEMISRGCLSEKELSWAMTQARQYNQEECVGMLVPLLGGMSLDNDIFQCVANHPHQDGVLSLLLRDGYDDWMEHLTMKVALDYGCARITDMFPSFAERIGKKLDAPKRMELLVCSLSQKDEKSARTFASTLDEFYLATISSELMGKKEKESLGLPRHSRNVLLN